MVVSVAGNYFLDLIFKGEAGLVVVLADEGFVLGAEVVWTGVEDTGDE